MSLSNDIIDFDMPVVDFPQSENQPFSLKFGEPYNPFTKEVVNNHDYSKSAFSNGVHHFFDASSLNFNANNYEFTSIVFDKFSPVTDSHKSITFELGSGTLDFSSFTPENSLKFQFPTTIFDTYDIEYDNTVKLSKDIEFEASNVTFRSDSITFDYEAGDMSYDPGAFAANANLYDYKFSTSDFAQGIKLNQLNASDFRALDYAFEGDTIFDYEYYTSQGITPDGMNPFTDYIENGWKFGIDPSPAFDVDYYLNNNPDVKNAGLEPLSDYVQRDWSDFYDINSNEEDISQDPHPLFSTEFVKATNIDKIDEIVTKGNLTSSPLEFYLDSSDLELDSEVRFTHPVSISENQVKFTTFINAQSEGFEYAQFEFEKLGINLTPQENGQISVAQSIGIDPIEELIDAVKYTVLAGGTYLFSGEIVEDAQTIFEFATETLSYATLSFTPEDISVAPLPFPGETEAPITIESFPKGTTVEEILGTADNIFSTPLEPIDELANSTESFPQRDEILDSILDSPLIFPGEQVPTGTYAYPTDFSSETIWSQGYVNGEDENITISPPTMPDIVREKAIRQELAVTGSGLNRRNRDLVSSGSRNIAFADYSIGNKTGTIKSVSGKLTVELDNYAPFVPLEDRVLQTYTVDGVNKVTDSEAKILELILADVFVDGATGTIRFVSTNPVCNSCGQVIEDFIEFVEARGGEIAVEVIELRTPR